MSQLVYPPEIPFVSNSQSFSLLENCDFIRVRQIKGGCTGPVNYVVVDGNEQPLLYVDETMEMGYCSPNSLSLNFKDINNQTLLLMTFDPIATITSPSGTSLYTYQRSENRRGGVYLHDMSKNSHLFHFVSNRHAMIYWPNIDSPVGQYGMHGCRGNCGNASLTLRLFERISSFHKLLLLTAGVMAIIHDRYNNYRMF